MATKPKKSAPTPLAPASNELMLAESNAIYLCGDIDDEMGRKVITGLYQLQARGSKQIRLMITTGGGSLFSTLAIMDTLDELRRAKVKVTGDVMGVAASGGAYILLACGHRRASASSVLMVHGLTDHLSGDVRDMDADRAINAAMMKSMAGRFAAKTRHNQTYWNGLLKDAHPHWYTAGEALKEGLIDEIV